MNSEPCAGTNCDGHPHSPECRAEHAAACGPVGQAEPVACACGDIYSANSYGAGYIDASGRCPNCDAAAQAARPAAQGALSDWLESQDFYEACQAYRHAKDATPGFNAASAFEGLKAAILGAALSTQPGDPT